MTLSLLLLVFVSSASSIIPLHFVHAVRILFLPFAHPGNFVFAIARVPVLVSIEMARLAVIPKTIAHVRLFVEGRQGFFHPALDTDL